MSSPKLFPPVVRRLKLTDHSVASILAPETIQRQAANVPPSGDERRQREPFRVTDAVESRGPLSYNLAPFDDLDHDSISEEDTDSARRQNGPLSSLSVYADVDASRRDGGWSIHQLYQPWRENQNSWKDERLSDRQQMDGSVQRPETSYGITSENGAKSSNKSYRLPSRMESIDRVDQLMREDQKNAEVDAANIQPVLLKPQTVGFQTSAAAAAAAEDRSEAVDMPACGVLRPIPTFPRPSTALLSGAPSVSPQLELESGDLWRLFDQFTTEMVITKSGRLVSL